MSGSVGMSGCSRWTLEGLGAVPVPEQRRQLGTAPGYAGAHRAWGNVQSLADLLVGQFAQIAQHHRRSVLGGETGQSSIDIETNGGRLADVARRRRVIR